MAYKWATPREWLKDHRKLAALGDAYVAVVDRPGQWHIFGLDECETCGREVQRPNAVQVLVPEEALENAGLERREAMPPEIWHDDELDQTVCERDDCKGDPREDPQELCPDCGAHDPDSHRAPCPHA